MNMSPFNVPLRESFYLVSFQPFLMHCGNHGNNTALSVKVTLCNTSEQEADG